MATIKRLDSAGALYYTSKLKNTFALATHTHGAAEISGKIAGTNITGAVASATNASTAGALTTGAKVPASQITGAVASATNAGTAGALSTSAKINGTQVTGAVSSATNASTATVASGLTTTAKVPASQITGAVASATNAATAGSVAWSNVTDKVTASTSADGLMTSAMVTKLDSNWYLKQGTAIPSGADLNTYTTAGVYTCGSATIANSLSNKPEFISYAFKLIVDVNMVSGSSQYLTQMIYCATNDYTFLRYCSGNPATASNWKDWQYIGKYSTITLENPATSSLYNIPFVNSGTSATQLKALRINDGVRFATSEGTTTTAGGGQLVLGNIIASGTEGNKSGSVRLYSETDKYAIIKPVAELTANRVFTLPDKGGTLITTNDTFVGATDSAAGTAGLVPAPAKDEELREKYLCNDGTWQNPFVGARLYTEDLNDIKIAGRYYARDGHTCTNLPREDIKELSMDVHLYKAGSTDMFEQVVYGFTTSFMSVWRRTHNSGGWSSWVEMYSGNTTASTSHNGIMTTAQVTRLNNAMTSSGGTFTGAVVHNKHIIMKADLHITAGNTANSNGTGRTVQVALRNKVDPTLTAIGLDANGSNLRIIGLPALGTASTDDNVDVEDDVATDDTSTGSGYKYGHALYIDPYNATISGHAGRPAYVFEGVAAYQRVEENKPTTSHNYNIPFVGTTARGIDSTGRSTYRNDALRFMWDGSNLARLAVGGDGMNGIVRIYRNDDKYLALQTTSGMTANRVITFPDAAGTVSLDGHTHNSLSNTSDTSVVSIYGATSTTDGAWIGLSGQNRATSSGALAGVFRIAARGASTSSIILEGKPDGSLTWNGNDVIIAKRPNTSSTMNIYAATATTNGAWFALHGMGVEGENSGAFRLGARNTTTGTSKILVGKPDGTLTWNGKRLITEDDVALAEGVSF